MKTLIRNAINRSRTPEEEIAQHIIAVDTKIHRFVHHMNVLSAQHDVKTIDAAILNQDRALLIEGGILSHTEDHFDARVVKTADAFTQEHAAFQAAFTSEILRKITGSVVFDSLLEDRIESLAHNSGLTLVYQKSAMADVREGTGAFDPETMDLILRMRASSVEMAKSPQPSSDLSLNDMDHQPGPLAGTAIMLVWSAYCVNALVDDVRGQAGYHLDRSIAPSAEDLRVLIEYAQAHEVEALKDFENEAEEHGVALNV